MRRPMTRARWAIVSVLGGALLLMAGCSPSPAVSTSAAPSPSADSAAFAHPDCPPIDLRSPDGERVDLTGEWTGTPFFTDDEVIFLNQIGDCVFGSVAGVNLDGTRSIINLTGRLEPDFTMNVLVDVVLQEGQFGFGETSAMGMFVEWDEDARMRLREDREPGEQASRCVIDVFDCPAPLIWYQTDP